MPWPHCDLVVNDDVVCPTCGMSKQEWSIKVDITRVFRIGAGLPCKVELRGPDEKYQAGARYHFVLPDGSEHTGELNPAGYAKANSRLPGDAVVSFLGDEPVECVSGTARATPDAETFLCPVGPEKHLFRIPATPWLKVRLTDDEGAPRAGERYELTLPDGSRREGTLDERGVLRVVGLPAGATRCRVRFPDIDQHDLDAPVEGTAWIEVRLVDDEGAPRRRERYELTFPDGSRREGTLDDDGVLRAVGITGQATTCRVSFPDLDERDFELPLARTAWLGVRLVDDDGAPLAGERYVLTMSDGTTREGTLDGKGGLHEAGLPDRPCRLAFPDRDQTDFDPSPAPGVAWLAASLVDEVGAPLAGERYVLTLPDESTREGRLDGRGGLHESGLPEGTCRLSFPDRDETDFATSPTPGVAWLAASLVDEDGAPLANERWVLTLPDGSTREGRLDGRGGLHESGLPEGTCRLSFPERDETDFASPPDGATRAGVDAAWLAASLVDEDGAPLANERWVLTLPDGSTREGRLDDQGGLREVSLPEGTCRLSFPDRDETDFAWPPDGATSAGVDAAWLAASLVDEDGAPLANERWVLTLPDGSTREGRLDGEGGLREVSLPEGTCRLSFPERDESDFAPPPDGAPPAPPEVAWLEVLLEDDDGAPVAGAAYTLTLPDGSTRDGRADGRGRVREERLPAAPCRLRLRDLDEAEVANGTDRL